jgi:glycosyltransferase involved in cell wall biosynthesis
VRARPAAVSVVIPTFNRPGLLERAVRSVLAQTFTDFEIIVVDDRSTDSIDAALGTCRAANARVIRLGRHRGAAAARNAGVRAARGRFVAFLDDDDRWLPTKLARQVARFEEAPAGTGLVYCGFRLVSDASGRIDRCYEPEEPAVTFSELLRSSHFGTSIPLIARECLDRVGSFDEELPASQDRDMWLRLARLFEFAFVPEILAECHVHGRQITTDLDAKIEAKERLLEKYGRDFERHPSACAAELVRLGMLHFAAGHTPRGRDCLLRAIERGASRERLAKHLALSEASPEAHRELVIRTAFRTVDGCRLY